MVKQNRNTIDGIVDKTAVNNKSPDNLCFDPSDASITPFSDKRGMRTKSWTPLLILTKSEPVLYWAQSS